MAPTYSSSGSYSKPCCWPRRAANKYTRLEWSNTNGVATSRRSSVAALAMALSGIWMPAIVSGMTFLSRGIELAPVSPPAQMNATPTLIAATCHAWSVPLATLGPCRLPRAANGESGILTAHRRDQVGHARPGGSRGETEFNRRLDRHHRAQVLPVPRGDRVVEPVQVIRAVIFTPPATGRPSGTDTGKHHSGDRIGQVTEPGRFRERRGQRAQHPAQRGARANPQPGRQGPGLDLPPLPRARRRPGRQRLGETHGRRRVRGVTAGGHRHRLHGVELVGGGDELSDLRRGGEQQAFTAGALHHHTGERAQWGGVPVADHEACAARSAPTGDPAAELPGTGRSRTGHTCHRPLASTGVQPHAGNARPPTWRARTVGPGPTISGLISLRAPRQGRSP